MALTRVAVGYVFCCLFRRLFLSLDAWAYLFETRSLLCLIIKVLWSNEVERHQKQLLLRVLKNRSVLPSF